jgi:transposase
MSQRKFVGVEASGKSIEVAVRPTGETWTTKAGEEGAIEIADRLVIVQPDLVVLEAYGRFELPVAGALASSRLPFALVSPRNVRDFARVIGKVTREPHDAELLAHFAEMVRPDPQTMSEQVMQQLEELKARRRELSEMLGSERNRARTGSPTTAKDVQLHIQFLERAIKLNSEHFNRIVRLGRLPSL